MLSKSEFDRLRGQGFNRIPIVREVLADLDTPVSTYLKLGNKPFTYLFESVQGGEKWGRYSIIGLQSPVRLVIHDHHLQMFDGDREIESRDVADPLAEISEFQKNYRVPEVPGIPGFTGGLVGFFGYDTVRYVEPRLKDRQKPDPIGAPDILLMVSEQVVVFDNLGGRLYVVVLANTDHDDAYEVAGRTVDDIVHQLRCGTVPEQTQPAGNHVNETEFHSSFSQQPFEAAVDACREYIRNGDIFQVVLSQRLSIPFAASPVDLYRSLRTVNPSPYLFLLNLGDFHIVGSSPEILVRLDKGEVTVRPIAGTRPRGADTVTDQALADDLMADPKELAEHLMLVDLGRNDVGRVARTGTVKVTDQMTIERYSHVMHIVSNVTGDLKPDMDAIDVMRATFPAGTLSGAPKVRAMEIIDEFEPEKRGIYAGAVGYIGWDGAMDTAIAIRTAVIKDETLYIQAGAGIVAESVPRNEWDETMNKARAVFRAVSMANAGLDLTALED